MEYTQSLKKIDLPNGETYAYLDIGSGSQTILILHGIRATSVALTGLISVLSKKYRVIAPEFRGCGHSTYNNKYMTIKELTQDLKYFVELLDLKKFSIFGWSFGCGPAMQLASELPDHVEGIIHHCGLGPQGLPLRKYDENKQLTQERVYTYEEMCNLLSVKNTLSQNANKDYDTYVKYAKLMIYNGPGCPTDDELIRSADSSFMQRSFPEAMHAENIFNITHEHNGVSEGTGEIDNIKCKHLILCGKHDNFAALDINGNYFNDVKRFLGDKATIKMWEDGGHAVVFDHFEEVVKLIDDFCS